MTPIYALIIAPHPDDAEIGAGGTIARWIRESKEIVYVICTDGGKGTRDRSLTSEDLAVIRKNEQLRAAETLGVSDVVFLNYLDQELEDNARFRKDLVREIRRYKPEVVVTTDPYRRYIYHRDHRITGQAALDAVFPSARTRLSYPDLIAQGFEPHRVREMLFFSGDEINYRVDITDTFDIKIKALKCHRSQYNPDDLPSWFDWIKKHDQAMAEGEPYDLAEAFYRVVIR